VAAAPGLPRVVVVGLGPAGPESATAAALAAIDRVEVRFLRTARHPASSVAHTERTFDDRYEDADTFEEVYRQIVEDLVAAAVEHGEVLYAVPGSPFVLERSVTTLLADERVDVQVVPGMSFLDVAWARLGVDPVEAGARLVDGHLFAEAAAGERGPLLVAHAHARWVLSDIKLSVDVPPVEPVTVLQRLGLPDEAVFTVDWSDLDRSFEPDHLTALWVPSLTAPPGADVVRLEALMATLREQCPWDREQTHASLRRHLQEESHEVLEALDAVVGAQEADPGGATGEPGTTTYALDDRLVTAYEHLEEELGDLLFQIVFHARIASEAGAFTLADVARGIHDKLVARHPHVFEATGEVDPATLVGQWERLKQAEKGRDSVLDGIPATLPALARAAKVLGKARTVSAGSALEGLPDVAVSGRAVEVEPDEESVGEALLALVAVARAAGIDPEAALRRRTDVLAAAVRATEAADGGVGPD
jgi:tetrapyrrole methylase family protein/MazG family protein